MAIDTRDWYRDAQRKRQRYTERAKFRVNLTEQRRRTDWRDFWTWGAAIAAGIVATMALAKWLLHH